MKEFSILILVLVSVLIKGIHYLFTEKNIINYDNNFKSLLIRNKVDSILLREYTYNKYKKNRAEIFLGLLISFIVLILCSYSIFHIEIYNISYTISITLLYSSILCLVTFFIYLIKYLEYIVDMLYTYLIDFSIDLLNLFSKKGFLVGLGFLISLLIPVIEFVDYLPIPKVFIENIIYMIFIVLIITFMQLMNKIQYDKTFFNFTVILIIILEIPLIFKLVF